MLEYQAGHAIVWRDAICSWFLRMSEIPDAKGRAGHFPNRVEAESMKLEGYRVESVTPWEDASGGKAIECREAKSCSEEFTFEDAAGWYDLDVQYFDVNTGAAEFKVYVGEQLVDQWAADAQLPATAPNGDSSTRRRITRVVLRPKDTVRVEGIPNGGDAAALDYVEVVQEAK